MNMDYIMKGDEGVFDLQWIKDNFKQYMEEIVNERDDKDEISKSEIVSDFVEGWFWADLFERGFYDSDKVSDLYLINYLKKGDGCYEYFVEFTEKEENIYQIREKLVYMVFEIKMNELVSLELI